MNWVLKSVLNYVFGFEFWKVMIMFWIEFWEIGVELWFERSKQTTHSNQRVEPYFERLSKRNLNVWDLFAYHFGSHLCNHFVSSYYNRKKLMNWILSSYVALTKQTIVPYVL